MTLKNLDVRLLISESDLTFKDVAGRMGVSRVWLSHLLRYDLTPKNRKRVLTAVRELKHEQKEEE